ncbi:hypothetical protein FIT74_03475 [Candidatus Methylopumilus universalis]|jgi:hypothetical protein|uniref:DUF4398 domain-containing protein n=1 Tax=Candidatus Methylopumilus universalis TaxID=2588536 RepID=A0ABX5VVW8_9PROT|nr:hypothetical protein [Candidatus Methylopumilus universalis]QDC51096.1 hypothetical protein FIT73_03425 [Candidatus Methylopumilus universalis]QDC61233.1 hypothetical protein FIT74_03475 [Candidatus Methylopumilus universalis]
MKMKRKKLKRINLILIGVTLLAISTAVYFYVKTLDSHFELEHSLRLENLAVIALNNGDRLLACKALEESKKALEEADFRAKDLAGMVRTSANEVCEKLVQK